jgi:hypothetical protein
MVMIFEPNLLRRFIISEIASSFPGIIDEERTIVSLGLIEIVGWSPREILLRPPNSSPWAPVVMMICLLSGILSIVFLSSGLDDTFFAFYIAHFSSYSDTVDHATTIDEDSTSEFLSDGDDILYTAYKCRKITYDNSLSGIHDDFVWVHLWLLSLMLSIPDEKNLSFPGGEYRYHG